MCRRQPEIVWGLIHLGRDREHGDRVRMKRRRSQQEMGYLLEGKCQEERGSSVGVTDCPRCPSTVLMDEPGKRPTLVLLALLTLALEPDEE